MNQRTVSIAALTAVLCISTQAGAQAQGVQNWINNELNKVQQDYGSGQINANQAANLTARDQQIQNQEQRDLIQNGGTLTPQQSRQLAQELQRNNRHINGDVARDNPAAYPNGYGSNQWQTWRGNPAALQNPTYYQGKYQQYYQNLYNQQLNGQAVNGQPLNGQQYHHRHHREDMNQ